MPELKDTVVYVPDAAFKALATIGIWLGAGLACWPAPEEVVMVIVAAAVTTVIVWLV